MVIEKTVGEIAADVKLNKKVVLKHLHSGALPYEEYKNSKYSIIEEKYFQWKNNIPDLADVQAKSIFSNADEINNNNIDLIKENDLKLSIEEFINFKKIDAKSDLTFADMFCGCGGLSLGFVQAGFRPIECVDIFFDALSTYHHNIISMNKFAGFDNIEISDITQKEVKERIIAKLKKENVKVICGGFPCQGFSMSGTGVATDPRNTLYLDMLEIVKETKPDYIVMENVVGLANMLKGRVLNKIVSDYEKIGYKISYKILNAVNYGVAQNRKRIIFIGNRLNKQNPFPALLIKEEKEFITVRSCIERYGNEENRDINHFFSNHSQKMKKRLREVEIGGHLYENYHDSWRKTDPDKPSCTIKENHGATNIHYEYDRTMSPRELAALQSFPDDFIFIGSKLSILKQIGNAVPPLLAKAIALSLKKELESAE